MPAAITLRSVSREYNGETVVRDVDLEVAAGETFALIGPSGSGKTTTLKMINRLVEPTAGELLINGRDARSMDAADLRRGIGYVIQESGLFAHYTVRQNIAVVPRLLKWPENKIVSRTDELLEIVGLPAKEYANRFPHTLSGGQKQRIGIARALAADPPIVLLDEPFSALDAIAREHLQDEFLALSKRLKKTFVMVTHDIFEAVRLADRIGVMRDGRLVQCDAPGVIVRKPADSFVTSFLGRHRYQLRLMTTTVGDVEPISHDSRPPNGTKSISVSRTDSVWSALERMADDNAGWLSLTDGDQWISRETLVSSVAN